MAHGEKNNHVSVYNFFFFLGGGNGLSRRLFLMENQILEGIYNSKYLQPFESSLEKV